MKKPRIVPILCLLYPGAISAAGLLLIFGVLVRGGWLGIGPAFAAASVALAFQFILLRTLARGQATMARGLEALREGGELPKVRPVGRAESELWNAVLRLVRKYRQRIQALDRELSSANTAFAALPEPVLLVSAKREITRCNGAACALFGEALAGRDLSAAIRAPAVLAAADAVLQGGGAQEVEFRIGSPVERVFRAGLEPIRSPEAALLLTLADLTMAHRLEQLRGDFVANVSHELRTPLSSVIGFIETLEGPAAEDADARRRFLPIMRQQAARMARLVDDLLSLSRIELNEHLAPRTEVDVGSVIRNVVQLFELRAESRRMRIEVELPEAPVIVPGDAEELVQLLQNLVDNAIKYGKEGTPVGVRLHPSPKLRNGIAIAVRDRGDGIAREHLPRLTERFYRVDTARSRAMGGTGLGLAIVKHIANRHRGVLEIDSEPGQGSTFTIHLPAVTSARPRRPSLAESAALRA